MIKLFKRLKKNKVRVRIAPSPTGYFHIGTARTALFNWLFARHMGGSFILRIEDTDLARNKPEYEKNIIESMEWLGLTYDEGPLLNGGYKGKYGPYRQTERLDSYERYLTQLLKEHKAFYCFCTKEELEGERISQEAAGQVPRYSGKCRSVTDSEVAQRIGAGAKPVIRLKVLPKKIHFTDYIRGVVEFDNALIGDVVIAKSLREPLYNFAVVIDDFEMEITDVIRGEEHLANTPKQLAIIEALGFPMVRYAHLPIILSATGKGKMSKRDGGTAIRDYQVAGYLPQAMINFVGLLGWHPSDDKELLTSEEMAKAFTLERVQKGGAKFNLDKLNWFNTSYIKALPEEELLKQLIAFGAIPSTHTFNNEQLLKVVRLGKERMIKLSDFAELAGFLFELPAYDPKLLVWKKGTPENAKEHLSLIATMLEAQKPTAFTKAALEALLMPMAEAKGRGDVLWPLRTALSGKAASPGPFEILDALQKDESLKRIRIAIEKLSLPIRSTDAAA